MPSLSQTASLTCPACKKSFQTELWLIVDAAEHPELIAQVKDGRLHEIPCPHCGHRGQMDAPLLLYLPGQAPPLLFSPAEQTGAEEDAEHARQLLAWLHLSLGDAWREGWLAQGLPAVPRAVLPTALSEGLEAVARQMAEEMAQALERLRQENPEESRQLEEMARIAAAMPPDLRDLLAELAATDAEIRDIPRRVELVRRALTMVPRARAPVLWAALQCELGTSLAQSPRGERAENLERAIEIYHQALEVRTREAMPVEWAQTMNNLAAAYVERILGWRGDFWQHESYDHVVRNERAFQRILACIVNNPVQAGLVEDWQEWPYLYDVYL